MTVINIHQFISDQELYGVKFVIFSNQHIKAMTIFGKAIARFPCAWGECQGHDIMYDNVIREGNNWDIFLNYFFALLFLLCLLIGIVINPFIILYHSKQNRSFANILFLLISSIDQIKSIYFPLVLLPRLLSPQDDQDYYYIFNPTSIHWTSYLNHILIALTGIETEMLIVLCVVRYLAIRRPLTAATKRNVASSSVLLILFVFRVAFIFLGYVHKPLGYSRITDFVTSMNPEYVKGLMPLLSYIVFSLKCLFLLIGGLSSGLTIIHLKNSDTAASDASARNIRRGIVAIVAMNVFNISVIISILGMSITMFDIDRRDAEDVNHTTVMDFILFTYFYGIPLIQSGFNSISFLIISSSFKVFVKKLFLTRRQIKPSRAEQQENEANLNTLVETTA